MFSLNGGGRLLDLTQPVIMGIINATPDSFFDGGKYTDPEKAVERAGEMIGCGATILDIGGMSSRPGASIVPLDEEVRRVVPVIEAIRNAYPEVFLSVDTFRKEVAEAAFEHGVDIINDISAGELDPSMLDFVAQKGMPYILMHMKGVPSNMQDAPRYENVVQFVLQYLIGRVALCESKGIRDVVIDPGFGFGKSLEHNYELLSRLEVLGILEKPVLVGISRKSMIYKAIGKEADSADYGTTAAHMAALQKNAKILRVHDVEAARQAIAVWKQMQPY
jgi:dihydropteroate synthase